MSLELLSVLKPSSEEGLPFVEDLILFAYKEGHTDIAKRLKAMRRNFKMKVGLSIFFKALLGQSGKRLAQRLRPKEWQQIRLLLLPKFSKLE